MCYNEFMEKILENFPGQCREALNFGKGIEVKDIDNIAVLGMGGSGFGGDVLRDALAEEIPVAVARDYNLPIGANDKTLVFAVSYSGDTEETLSAASQARQRGHKIICIGSGGKLEEFAAKSGLNFVKVPAGLPPRNALGYLTLPMFAILQENNFIENKNLESIAAGLDIEKSKKEGEKIAGLFLNKIPLIYSGYRFRCLAYGWKTRLNENAKIHAFANCFSELNHNEIAGYADKNKIKDFFTLIIKDRDDGERTQKRFLITEKLINDRGGECFSLETGGSNLISRIFSNLYVADWASYYLARIYGVDPVSNQIIDELKRGMEI